jgi:hypothetical protein
MQIPTSFIPPPQLSSYDSNGIDPRVRRDRRDDHGRNNAVAGQGQFDPYNSSQQVIPNFNNNIGFDTQQQYMNPPSFPIPQQQNLGSQGQSQGQGQGSVRRKSRFS